MTSALQDLFQFDNKKCEILSLDDFYLTNSDQMKLSHTHGDNSLLQYRGNAGTHDLPLLERVLNELKDSNDKNIDIRIPRYDKSCFDGRGDRAPEEEWTVVEGPPDVVILEGWMLGFTPKTGIEHDALTSNMKDINSYMYLYRNIHSLMDSWIVLDAQNLDYVYSWRQEAETNMSMSGKSSMTQLQVS